MWGRKSREIADLTRALRVAQQRLADTRDDGRSAAADACRAAARLTRALEACRRYRAELAVQRRVTNRLASQLLDATGYKAEPLLPAARQALGITPKDVRKGAER